MSRYGRKRISRRDVLKAAGALAASVAALGGGAWLLQRMDDEQDRANASDSYTTNDHRTAVELKEITYKGKNYRQRPDLESYLFLGIDVMGPAVGTQSYVAGGQADTQILLVLDNAAKTWQLLQINRDSMVEVPVLSMMGTVAYTIKQQIALAHAYGNGREQSCENNVLAVSMLLDDQPIDGYFSLNMGGVGILVDLIGGVTLTVTSDFSAIDPSLVEGETITLNGEQAFEYVRQRQNVDDQTNLARMARQRQFLTAFEEKVRGMDPEFAVTAYEELSEYVITDIASGTAVDIADKLKTYTEQPLLTINGENTVEDGYWAYYLDEDSLQETILQLFYAEI